MKRNFKKVLSFIVIFAIIASIGAAMPLTAHAQTQIFNYEGYRVDYNIQSSWGTNQSVTVTLTNTGTEPIRNWALQYDPHGTITGLWDGEVFGDNIVKSRMYNSDLAVGASVTFGYILTNATGTPSNFNLANYRVEKEDGFSVNFNTTPAWGTYFNGSITIRNTTNAPIMAWELSFDSNFEIASVNNFVILENEGTYYRITGAHNGNIPANSSITLGFTGNPSSGATISDVLFTEVIVSATPIIPDDPGDDLILHYVSLNADYEPSSGIVNLFWISAVEEGIFELFYSLDNEEYLPLATVENESNHEYITDGEDFIIKYFKAVQIIDDEIVAASNICYVIWSPDGICWTEYMRDWTIEADDNILSEINDDNSFYTLSVSFEAAGVPDVHLNVTESGYSYVMQNHMILGVIPELIYPSQLNVENVTLNFEIADEHLENVLGIFTDHPEFEGIKRLNVFKWFDEINMSLPIETKFDIENNILYTEVDRLGTFCIMDMEMWFEFLGVEAEEAAEESFEPIAPMFASIEAASSPSPNAMIPPFPAEFFEDRFVYIDVMSGRYRMFVSQNRPTASVTQFADEIRIVNPFNIYSWDPAISDVWTVSPRTGIGSSVFTIRSGIVFNSPILYSNFDIMAVQGGIYFERNSIDNFYEHVRNRFRNIDICGVDNFQCRRVDCRLCPDPDCGTNNFVCNKAECKLCNPDPIREHTITLTDGTGETIRSTFTSDYDLTVTPHHVPVEKDNRPVDIVFMLQAEGVCEDTFNYQRSAIINTSERIFDNYAHARIYIVSVRQTSSTLLNSGGFTNISSITNTLNNIQYVVSNSQSNWDNTFNTLLNNINFRDKTPIIAFNFINGNAVVSNFTDNMAKCRSKGIIYNEIVPANWTLPNGGVPSSVRGNAIGDTSGLVLWSVTARLESLVNTIYSRIPVTLRLYKTEYGFLLATNWGTIELDGALSSYNSIDTDGDGLTDWEEVDFRNGLITRSGCSRYITKLPSIQDCINYVINQRNYSPYFKETEFLFKFMNRFPSEFQNVLNNEVLPILSDPTKRDTDGDGIWDGDDVFPFKANVIRNVSWRTANDANILDVFANKHYVENTAYDIVINLSDRNKNFIFGQRNDQGVGNMRFGGARVSRTGCGVISIYNVLNERGRHRDLSSIIYEFDLNPHSKTMSLASLALLPVLPKISLILNSNLWNGNLGASPFGISDYFDHHRTKYEMTWCVSEFASWAKEDRVFIILYWNDMSSLTAGAHYVMIQSDTNGNYTTYNQFGNQTGTRTNQCLWEDILTRKDSPSEVIHRGFIAGFYIPVERG
jgi:hypothetical protein